MSMGLTRSPHVIILALAAMAMVAGLVMLFVTPSGPASVEAQAREIERSLVCPVCPNQLVAGSDNQIAKDMRDLIRKKLAAGESKEQVVQYFVDRYGPSVLAAPPKKGLDLTVWLAPAFALVAGAAILYVAWRARRKTMAQGLEAK